MDTSFQYFAYGSNLSSARIRLNNPSAVAVGPAILRDYKLDFNYFSKRWRGAPATIVRAEGESVCGMLWRLDLKHQSTLDDQEGVKNNVYLRFSVEVAIIQDGVASNDTVSAETYQLHPERCTSKGLEKLPSKVYLNVMLSGAKENNFPVDYIQKLEEMENNGYIGEVDVELPLNVIS